MNHFKRNLIEATFDQLTKSQHEVCHHTPPPDRRGREIGGAS
jgi:hypothetical protein